LPIEGRIFDLLADRATEGLDEVQAVVLEHWLSLRPAVDAGDFDRTAAQIALTVVARCREPLPDSLRERIQTDARFFFTHRAREEANGYMGRGKTREESTRLQPDSFCDTGPRGK
jgi:hypothetical protein